MTKILVIEDDEVIADGLALALTREGYEVLLATDGITGLHMARTNVPRLIVLDIMMPYMNGFEVTTELRRVGESIPIIILSARTALKDRIRGLDLGADDYLVKPFEIDELLARIRRRLSSGNQSRTDFGDKYYDWSVQGLFDREGSRVDLTTREQLLLEYLLNRAGRIISRNQIIESVWGDDYDGSDRTVDNFIVRLRRKIGSDHLVTVHGQGYRFEKKRSCDKPVTFGHTPVTVADDTGPISNHVHRRKS